MGIIQQITTGRALDLYSGIGGWSLGLQEAGFKSVTGMELDPLAVSIYRERVGPCWEGNIGPQSHPPFQVDVVTADIPEKRVARKLTSEEVIPEIEVFSTLKIATEAQAKVVIFSLVPWGETSVMNFEVGKFSVIRHINEEATQAGFRVSAQLFDAVDYGLPQ